jgi:hypothetical protein
MLSRKIKRLSVMGPREIFFRLGRKAAEQGRRIAYHTGRLDWSPQAWRKRLCCGISDPPVIENFAAELHRHFRERVEPPMLLDANSLQESKALYFRLFKDHLDSLCAKADRVCAGRFGFLGIEFQTADPIPWRQDPKTGKIWPAKFHAYMRIPFCDGIGDMHGAPDVKYVWELNRHEFLLDCAKAYYLTGEERYAERVFAVMSSWIQGNPYLQGVNWAGPLEVAVRSLAWLWCYQFCRSWKGLSADIHLELIKSFYQHGSYLHRLMERYSSPNNHLIGEAAALYLLGGFFPEFDEATAWREGAWRILAAEPEKQFYADGGSTEQSTSYHHYCLGFFLLAMLLRRRQEQPVPESMLNRLEAAMEFSLWMTTPDGTVPRIGDTDDARSIRFGEIRFWDFRNLLSLGASIFNRGDLKAAAGAFSEDALWLLGPAGYANYEALPAQPPVATSRIFPHSGYAIFRSGWGPEDHHLCFDGGPIGVGLHGADIPSFTHGHADILSVTASVFGKPLLVDAGFYTYNGSPAWHRYCRDIRGHNTVSVDGASQAKFASANHWSCAAKPSPILWRSKRSFEYVEGSHSGFHGLADRISHQRTLFYRANGPWLILDQLKGEGEHLVEVFFHFAPGTARILPQINGVAIETEERIHAILKLATPQNRLAMELRCGGPKPEDGWIATGYGQRQPAPVLRFHGRVQLPTSLAFILLPLRSAVEPWELESEDCLKNLGLSLEIIDYSLGESDSDEKVFAEILS